MKKLQFQIIALFALVLLGISLNLQADAGVIIPTNHGNKPNPSILSLKQMAVSIRLDNNYAKVKVVEIFQNHTKGDLEGKYIFTLPQGAMVSDFVIWEDGVRIPGVIVERKRARQIYEELTFMKIDPGLMETTSLDNRNTFSVEIYPIPAYGTKRVEIEYTQEIGVDSLSSNFNFPLKPDLYGSQSCDIFDLSLEVASSIPMKDFKLTSSTYPLVYSRKKNDEMVGSYSDKKVNFKEDFSFEYKIDSPGNSFAVVSHRDITETADLGPFSGGKTIKDEYGYFEASAVFNLLGDKKADRPAKDVVVLVDTSLSMQWDKLEQSYRALEYFLSKLPAKDHFALVTFNSDVSLYSQKLEPVTPEGVQGALDFFKKGYLTGGTNLAKALETALATYPGTQKEKYLILISDGAPTLDDLKYASIAKRVKAANAAGYKLMIFGIGDDTNISLLETLAHESGGHFVWVSDTEDIEFKLTTFLDKLGEKIVTNLKLLFDKSSFFSRVYTASKGSAYDRTKVTWLGRYNQPVKEVKVIAQGEFAGEKVRLTQAVEMPEENKAHSFLPRRWAKLRVDYLLTQIEMMDDPEKAEPLIEEVIMLAKRYKFVTPYTSFLAAPRSLLRPRAIKPGDPILRVKTIDSIEAVVADFPFGLTKPLHYIADEDVWEVRFLAPKEMKDGTYNCNLLLSDKQGNLYSEEKEFVIDSKPPTLKVTTDKDKYLPGQEVKFKVYADQDTRRIFLKLDKLARLEAHYQADVAASTASLTLPLNMPPGKHLIKVTAIDFARNTTVIEIPLEIAR